MSVPETTTARRHSQEGFTLVELSMAILIAGLVLAALAGALGGGLRNVAAQKARTDGNELATQGIEDLQRYSYEHLGVCDTAATPPAGFETPASLANCTSPTYVHPCGTATGANPVPATTYTCTRRNITYNVRRYVAYGNVEQTTKRLAVVVVWTDTRGRHEVSQQSSLRSPTEASVIGISPPSVTTATVTPTTAHIDSSGRLTGATPTVSLTATSLGMTPADSMVAHFKSLVDGQVRDQMLAMTSVDGITWTKTITADMYTFGKGSQFFYFNAVRANDGKGNSRVSGVVKFCTPTDSTCSSSSLPQITPMSVPATADIDPGGILQADVNVVIDTRNVADYHQVTMIFQTQAGAYTVALLRDPAVACTASSCRWTGKISKQAGYRFYAGTQKFYFTAAQPLGTGALDQGSTGAASSGDVTFG